MKAFFLNLSKNFNHNWSKCCKNFNHKWPSCSKLFTIERLIDLSKFYNKRFVEFQCLSSINFNHNWSRCSKNFNHKWPSCSKVFTIARLRFVARLIDLSKFCNKRFVEFQCLSSINFNQIVCVFFEHYFLKEEVAHQVSD